MHLVRCSWIAGLLLSLVLGGCSQLPSPVEARDGQGRFVELRILAFNDFHGNLEPPSDDLGGAAYLAAHLRRAAAPHTVTVSAGDLVGASPLISGLFHDEPTVKAANLMGLDINAVGNHEFDEGWQELLRIQRGGHRDGGNPEFAGADFDILAANVIVEASGKTLLPPYTIRHYDGIPVAFIGLPLRDVPTVVVASGIAGLAFEDEVKTINALVAELRRAGVEAIVVVIHQGGYPGEGTEDECRDFAGPIVDIVARTDPAVDLFVTGHTHRHYLCSLDGRPVTSAASMGRYYTRIDARLDRASGDMAIVGMDNVPVTHDVEPVSEIAALVAEYRARVEEISKSVVGTIIADITKAPNARGGSQLGALIADAQLAATQAVGGGDADVAFMNPGGIRTDLIYAAADDGNDGEVTFAEIAAVQPFGNTLVTMTLTGAELDTLLEQQWAGQPAPVMLAPSQGFSYAWSRSAAEGDKVDPASIRLNGEVIRPEGRYRVTVNNFLAAGGDGFPVLAEGRERVESVLDIDALKNYLQEHSPIAPRQLDRIRVAP